VLSALKHVYRLGSSCQKSSEKGSLFVDKAFGTLYIQSLRNLFSVPAPSSEAQPEKAGIFYARHTESTSNPYTIPMILEGLVTTTGIWGEPHLAPMGPRIDSPEFTRFTLRPFNTSTTYQNLRRHREGVLHTTDDVLLLARAAVGQTPLLEYLPAKVVQGFIVPNACRYFEFRITEIDDSAERITMQAEVVASGRLREFFGLNRAKHAIVEAAILATRIHMLDRDEIAREYQKLRVLVEKTGGPSEYEAMEFLEGFLKNAS